LLLDASNKQKMIKTNYFSTNKKQTL